MTMIDGSVSAKHLRGQSSTWTLVACSFAFVIVQLDITIVNVALPRIGTELDASVTDLQWVVDAYTIAFAVFLLSAGALGDYYGSKRIFLTGFIVFFVASALCSLANAPLWLNVARAVQGIGAALLVPSSLAILNRSYAYDKKRLARAIALWTAAGGVSIAAGPIVGGVLLSIWGWRSVFWVNLPFCAVGFLLVRNRVPTSLHNFHTSLDFAGQLSAIVAITALMGAAIEAPAFGLSHPLVVVSLMLGVISTFAFIMVEKYAHAPMIPLKLFHEFEFTGAVLFGVLVNFAYYGVIFVLSLYLQIARNYSPVEAGLAFLPLTGTLILSNIASGWMSGRYGLHVAMMTGGMIGSIGYALLATIGIGPDVSFVYMLPGLILIPAGMGLAVPAMTTSVLSCVPNSFGGTASAILNAARQIGGAVGVAILGALGSSGLVDQNAGGVHTTLITSAVVLLAATTLIYLVSRKYGD